MAKICSARRHFDLTLPQECFEPCCLRSRTTKPRICVPVTLPLPLHAPFRYDEEGGLHGSCCGRLGRQSVVSYPAVDRKTERRPLAVSASGWVGMALPPS